MLRQGLFVYQFPLLFYNQRTGSKVNQIAPRGL